MTNGIRFQSVGALSVLAILILIVVIIVLIPLAFLGLIGAAFTRLGFSWLSALAVVLLILLGSTVNIPVYTIKRDMVRMNHGEMSMSDPYAAWVREDVWEIIISINLGGAVIPLCIALYVLYAAYPLVTTSLLVPLAIGTLGVSLITYASTRALPGVGIQVPLLIPALTALLIGLVFGGSVGLAASVTALVSGIFGVLVGGNLAQLGKIRDLGIPAMSIGGSGTFGSVLFCCILPALIA
ncbi:MAG TPA: DUF1614 domain-containing protein [Methanoregula sp.]|nr:DUF1614 domain-containing protein [Methanoregula sp.]